MTLGPMDVAFLRSAGVYYDGETPAAHDPAAVLDDVLTQYSRDVHELIQQRDEFKRMLDEAVSDSVRSAAECDKWFVRWLWAFGLFQVMVAWRFLPWAYGLFMEVVR